jgi:hypothetical protein
MAMRRGSEPSATRLTVGALEAFLRDHDVPPDAEVRLRRPGAGGPDFHVGGITTARSQHAMVLVLVEGELSSDAGGGPGG